MENKIPLPELPPFEGLSEEQKAENQRKEQYSLYASKLESIPKDVSESYDEQADVLHKALITTKTPVEPEKTLLAIDGVSVIEREDTYLIKGKPKSGKSSATKAIIIAALLGHCCSIKAEEKDLRVVYVDTEQKRSDTHKILLNVKRQADHVDDDYIDCHFRLLSLRKRTYKELVRDLLRIVIDYRPDIIILDGIADFVRSFNDEEASHNFYKMQQTIVEDFKSAIIGVIHENKAYDDHNAKGHLGQEGAQRAAIVMETRNKGGNIEVTCSESRHKSMPDWHLRYDEQGMLINAKESYATYQQKMKEQAAKKLEQERLELACSIIKAAESPITRAELSKKMEEASGFDRTTMASFITSQLEKTLFIVEGKIYTTPKAK